jgi:PPOX class probable F420-dependent enzyme
MADQLSTDQMERLGEFLEPSQIAVVATLGGDGMPQLTPNWYVYVDGKIAISTTKQRIKYLNLVRDERIAVCVVSEPLAAHYVSIRGRATIVDDASIWPISEAIVRRYVAPEGVQQRMNQLRQEDRIIIYVTPERVHFRD